MSDDIAVVHEHFPQQGGAERVADELGQAFDAPIFTSFISDDISNESTDIHELFDDSWWIKFVKQKSTLSALVESICYQFAWSRVPKLTKFDVLIQSGAGTRWYVPPDKQVIIRYIHTTPRYIYSKFHDSPNSILFQLYCYYMRTMVEQTISYADQYIANSELVARRISKYWGLDYDSITVIHPPVNVSSYEPTEGGDYYITLSRLVDHKRIKAIVNAFTDLSPLELRIVGEGPKRTALENHAEGHDNIKFEGQVSERRKRSLLTGAKASVYNAFNEDFGIVPVESLAAGTPVIGVRDGYTEHQIENGVTGILYNRGSVVTETSQNIIKAIDKFESKGVGLNAPGLHERATPYNVDRFVDRMNEVVKETQMQASIDL